MLLQLVHSPYMAYTYALNLQCLYVYTLCVYIYTLSNSILSYAEVRMPPYITRKIGCFCIRDVRYKARTDFLSEEVS